MYLQAPIGTYTAWNSFQPDLFDGGFCNFNGSFVPFAATKAQRDATGDLRPSLEERYPTKDAYIMAVKQAGEKLAAQRLMLREDVARLVAEAQARGVRTGS